MTVSTFYDQLSEFYHLIYPDWNSAITRQAAALDSVIQEYFPGAKTVLDLACGIGTQSLGLAKLGYAITASDISQASCDRARREAVSRGLNIEFAVADMLKAHEVHRKQFDLVIACDNAVPHLPSDSSILDAFRQMFACTNPGGGCIISVRDYAETDVSHEKVAPYGMRTEGGRTFILLQSWHPDPPYYDVDFYLIEDSGQNDCRTVVSRSRYYAITIPKLIDLMASSGFTDVRCLKDRFFQPIILGRRALHPSEQ